MKLDGYRPTDEAAAYERGVWRTYRFPAPYGPNGGKAHLKAKIKWAGAGNVGYRNAATQIHAEMADDFDRSLELVAAMYDHCIVEWSTNLQSGGQDLEPTKENFLMLATTDVPEVSNPMYRLLSDIQDRQTFIQTKREEAAKN